jgi:hypothetical protein
MKPFMHNQYIKRLLLLGQWREGRQKCGSEFETGGGREEEW